MKKLDLRNMIKEEIRNVLMEDTMKFPEVIEYKKDRKLSDLKWKVITTEKWTQDRAAEFQSAKGYSPAGYGGPYKFDENILPDGKLEYTWQCSASSG